MKIKFPELLEVFISPRAELQLKYYVEACSGEVSGLGRVIRLGPSSFLIKEIFLLEQEVSLASTTLSAEAVAKFMEEYLVKGGNPAELKLWWHSHGDMKTFWSSVDENTISEFKNEFMISIVANKKGERLCRVDFYKPIRFTLDEVPLKIRVEEDEKLKEEIQREVKEKVKELDRLLVRHYRWPYGYGSSSRYFSDPRYYGDEEKEEDKQ